MVTKILWGVLGLAMWGLAATGLLVFVLRQRVSRTASDLVVRAMTGAIAGGLPLATATAATTWAAALALDAPHVYGAMTVSFAGALVVTGVAGCLWSVRATTAVFFASAGALFAVLPAAAGIATGTGVVEVWSNPAFAGALVVDAGLVSLALALMAAACGLSASGRSAAREQDSARGAGTIREADLGG